MIPGFDQDVRVYSGESWAPELNGYNWGDYGITNPQGIMFQAVNDTVYGNTIALSNGESHDGTGEVMDNGNIISPHNLWQI